MNEQLERYVVSYKKPHSTKLRDWEVYVEPSGDVSLDRLVASRLVRQKYHDEIPSGWVEYGITRFET